MLKEIPNISTSNSLKRGFVFAVYDAFEIIRTAFFAVKTIFQLIFLRLSPMPSDHMLTETGKWKSRCKEGRFLDSSFF